MAKENNRNTCQEISHVTISKNSSSKHKNNTHPGNCDVTVKIKSTSIQNNTNMPPRNCNNVTVTSKSSSRRKGSTCKRNRAATSGSSGLVSDQSSWDMEQFVREMDAYLEEKLGPGTKKSAKKRRASISERISGCSVKSGKQNKKVRFSNVLEYCEEDCLVKYSSSLPENHSCTPVTSTSECDGGASFARTIPKCDSTKTKSLISPVVSKINISSSGLAAAHSPSLQANTRDNNSNLCSDSDPSINLSSPSSSQQTGSADSQQVEVSSTEAPVCCDSTLKQHPNLGNYAMIIIQQTMNMEPADKPTMNMEPPDKPTMNMEPADKPTMNMEPADKPLFCSLNQEGRQQRRVPSEVHAPENISASCYSPNVNFENCHNNTSTLLCCDTKLVKHNYSREKASLSEHLSSHADNDRTGDGNTSSGTEQQYSQLVEPTESVDSRGQNPACTTSPDGTSVEHKPSSVKSKPHVCEDIASVDCSRKNDVHVSGVGSDRESVNRCLKPFDGKADFVDNAVSICKSQKTPVVVPSLQKICASNCASNLTTQTTSSSCGLVSKAVDLAASFETISKESSCCSRAKKSLISTFTNKPETFSSSSALSITPSPLSSQDSRGSPSQVATPSASIVSSRSSNCSLDSVSFSHMFPDFESSSDSLSLTASSDSSDSEASSLSSTTSASSSDLTVLEAGKDFEPRVPHAFNKYCLCSLPLMCQGHETGPFRSVKLAQAVPVSRAGLRIETEVVLLPSKLPDQLTSVEESKQRKAKVVNTVTTNQSIWRNACKVSSADEQETYPSQNRLKDEVMETTSLNSYPEQRQTQLSCNITSISPSNRTTNAGSLNVKPKVLQIEIGLEKSEFANTNYSRSVRRNCTDELQNNYCKDRIEADAYQCEDSMLPSFVHVNKLEQQNLAATLTLKTVPPKEYLTSVPESSCCESDDSCSSFTSSQLGKTMIASVRHMPNLIIPDNISHRRHQDRLVKRSSKGTPQAIKPQKNAASTSHVPCNPEILIQQSKIPHQIMKTQNNTASTSHVAGNPENCPLFSLQKSGRVNKKPAPFPSVVNPQDSDSMGPGTRDIFQYHMTSRLRAQGASADPGGELSLSPWSPAQLGYGLDDCDDEDDRMEGVLNQPAEGGTTPVRKRKTSSENETSSATRFNIDEALLAGLEGRKQCTRNSSSPGDKAFKKPFPVTTSRRTYLKKLPSFTETGASCNVKDMTGVKKLREPSQSSDDQSCTPTSDRVTSSITTSAAYVVQCSRETGLDTQELFRTQKTPPPCVSSSIDSVGGQHIPGSLSSLLGGPTHGEVRDALTSRAAAALENGCQVTTTDLLQRDECSGNNTKSKSSGKNTDNKELSKTKEEERFPDLPAPGKVLAGRKESNETQIYKNTSTNHQQLSCSEKEHNLAPVISGRSNSFNTEVVPFNKEDIIEIISCRDEIDWGELSDTFVHDPTLVTPKNANSNIPSTPSKSTTNSNSESGTASFVSSSSNVEPVGSAISDKSIIENKKAVVTEPSSSTVRGRHAVKSTPSNSARGRRAVLSTPFSSTARCRHVAPDCKCQSCCGYKHLATSFMSKLFQEARTSCTTSSSGAARLTNPGSLASCIESISEEEQLSQKQSRANRRPRSTCRRRLAFVDSDSSSSCEHNPYRKGVGATQCISDEEDMSEEEVLGLQSEMMTTGGKTYDKKGNAAQDKSEEEILNLQPKIQTTGHVGTNKNNCTCCSNRKTVLSRTGPPKDCSLVESAANKPLVTTLLYNTIGQDSVRLNPYQKWVRRKSKSRKRVKGLKK